jgi:hypothetical protein
MTNHKLLSALLIAAAMTITLVLAREHHHPASHPAEGANALNPTPGANYIDGHVCYPAPRVGAFATQPWDDGPPCSPVPCH